MKKRGQKAVPGSAAGALIGLITLLIIFYIILIPPAEREALLGEQPYIAGEQTTGNGNIILQETIGTLTAEPKDKYEHRIADIYLKEITESTIIKQENTFMIKRGITSQYKTIEFAIENPEYTNNALISFNTPQHTGTLKIILNNKTIFEGEITTESPQPIRINKEYLQKYNTLELQVHGFGVPAKIYSFENFKIIADITNIAKQQASHIISITPAEYTNMEKAYLDYMPTCNQANIGELQVYINENKIFKAIPNCNSLARTHLFPQDLKSGSNEIEFRLINGIINLEQIRLKTFMKQQKEWSKNIYIPPEQHKQIQNNKAVLTIEFADDGYTKNLKLNINGAFQPINQREPYFSRDVSTVLRSGNNYISIKPQTDVNIIQLSIRIE